MAIEDLLSNQRKRAIDKIVDPLTVALGANVAYVWLSNQVVEYVSKNTESNEGVAVMGTYTALAAGMYLLNKFGVIPLAKKLYKGHKNRNTKKSKKVNPWDWLRTLAQLVAVPSFLASPPFTNTLASLRGDAERVVDAFSRDRGIAQQVLDSEPQTLPRDLDNILPKGVTEQEIAETNPRTERGKFLRAYRWNSLFSNAEQGYGIEEGLLGGTAMHESGGNPLAIGKTGDAGLMQLNPSTARAYGLRVYDSAGARANRNYSDKLRSLCEKHGWDYENLRRIDERFDVEKGIDAAARILKDNKKRCGSWDRAILGYNQGSCPEIAAKTKYVMGVRGKQRIYLEQKRLRFGMR